MEKKYLSELAAAYEFLKISKLNLKESLRTSANRLYFSLEKAVIAYFGFKKVKIPKNHQKLWELSSKYAGEDIYKLFRELYDLRMQADYGLLSIFVELNEENLKSYFSLVEIFINRVKKKLLKTEL